MTKKKSNPEKAEETASSQKLTPIGQDVPIAGFEIKPGKINSEDVAWKEYVGASKLHKDNGRPPVKIDINELKQLEAKGSGSTNMNTGDSKTPIPTKIDPKGTVDKTYKMQPEKIVTKKK